MTATDVDLAIVGAGIGGSALAVVMARAGYSVVLLEKTLEHRDVVRGEWLAPWGVIEANRLDLTSIYMRHGAHRLDRHIGYNDLMDPADAVTLDLNDVGERPLCLGHPTTCNVLNAEAVSLGVDLRRGVTKLDITPGTPPTISFAQAGKAVTMTPRWIVGADGRNGVVAKNIGCQVTTDPEHHLFSGMLVEDAHGWPDDLQVIATEGDAHALAFPQGDGRVRVYLGWPSHDRGRLLGPDGPSRFLASWDLDCVPDADAIVNATPKSRCIAYVNADAWVDRVVHDGVVLIGDAAGRNDPIIGQGLSIAHRDVRLVSEILMNESDWHAAMFTPYLEERAERMQRLRVSARLTSLRDSAFGKAGHRLRREIHERLAKTPDLGAAFFAPFVGPEQLPAEAFGDGVTTQIVGQPIWSELP